MKKEKQHQFYSAEDLAKLVAAKFPGPAWAVLNELRDGTGFNTAGRSADAIAFGTWPSRGLHIIGFEFKSYRGDWLSELRKPEKAESIGRFCDAWYLVAQEDVAKLEEIPPSWGWLCPTDKGLKCLKDPVNNPEPTPISRVFLMSIMRSLEKNYVPKRDVVAMAEAEAKKKIEQDTRELAHVKDRLNKLEKRCQEFKDASGLDIKCEYEAPLKELGAACKAVMKNEDKVKELHRRAQVDFENAKKTMEALEALRVLCPEGFSWEPKPVSKLRDFYPENVDD